MGQRAKATDPGFFLAVLGYTMKAPLRPRDIPCSFMELLGNTNPHMLLFVHSSVIILTIIVVFGCLLLLLLLLLILDSLAFELLVVLVVVVVVVAWDGCVLSLLGEPRGPRSAEAPGGAGEED